MGRSRDTLYALYALGELGHAEVEQVEAIAAADPIEAAKLDSFLDLVPHETPSRELRERLLASVGVGRFEQFSTRLAAVYDVTLDRARELLGLIDRAASWESPLPGVQLVHFTPGASYANADCGFVRIEPGGSFPWHTHRGEELCVVLEGRFSDHQGRTWNAGQVAIEEPGSAHDVRAGSEGVLFAARVIDGVEIVGVKL
jgi:putative transcriptional regulator